MVFLFVGPSGSRTPVRSSSLIFSRSPHRGVSCLVPLGGVSALLGLTCAILRRRVSCRCFLYLRRPRRWRSSPLFCSRSPPRGASCLVPSVGLVPSWVWGSGSRASLRRRAFPFPIAYGLVLSWRGARPPKGHTSSCVRSGAPSESHDLVIHHFFFFVRLFFLGFGWSGCSSFSRLFVLFRSPHRGASCLVPSVGLVPSWAWLVRFCVGVVLVVASLYLRRLRR